MKATLGRIRFNSDEFKAWHEVGHAAVCLHLNGDLELIEFLEEDSRGYAVARGCMVAPCHEQSVACAGFAAEFYLLRAGWIDEVNLNDPKDVERISRLVFSNAWLDQQAFVGRNVTEENDFTQQENVAFMNYAIERVAPIIDLYFSKMQQVVSELLENRTISGSRVKTLLGIPRIAGESS